MSKDQYGLQAPQEEPSEIPTGGQSCRHPEELRAAQVMEKLDEQCERFEMKHLRHLPERVALCGKYVEVRGMGRLYREPWKDEDRVVLLRLIGITPKARDLRHNNPIKVRGETLRISEHYQRCYFK